MGLWRDILTEWNSCIDVKMNIVSNYFTKSRGTVLSDFVIDPNKDLYICIPRDRNRNEV
jgi:hypothetical protein